MATTVCEAADDVGGRVRTDRRANPSACGWRWARVDSTPVRESIAWGQAADCADYLTAPFDQPGTPSENIVIAV